MKPNLNKTTMSVGGKMYHFLYNFDIPVLIWNSDQDGISLEVGEMGMIFCGQLFSRDSILHCIKMKLALSN